MNKALAHFLTITRHRLLVCEGCFKAGLYWQGLTHDLSKYSPAEFLVGVKYYQGDRSPNNAEREDRGYSDAWLHHKGRNRHHYEFWIDYSSRKGVGLIPVPMPDKYIVEMVMDRIAACKVYQKDAYTDASPLEYLESGRVPDIMHEYTWNRLHFLLKMLAEKGEDETFRYIREEFLKKDRDGKKKALKKAEELIFGKRCRKRLKGRKRRRSCCKGRKANKGGNAKRKRRGHGCMRT